MARAVDGQELDRSSPRGEAIQCAGDWREWNQLVVTTVNHKKWSGGEALSPEHGAAIHETLILGAECGITWGHGGSSRNRKCGGERVGVLSSNVPRARTTQAETRDQPPVRIDFILRLNRLQNRPYRPLTSRMVPIPRRTVRRHNDCL